jgi:adenylate cyclase
VPNQFIGDSVMALFGLECDPATASRQALAAAIAIEAGMLELNLRMQQEFGAPLDFGIGIHLGTASVGDVGWRETRTFSAVGDAVNTAARLQELCKTYDARLVVSEAVLRAAGHAMAGLSRHEVTVRGRSAPLAICAMPAPHMLANPA